MNRKLNPKIIPAKNPNNGRALHPCGDLVHYSTAPRIPPARYCREAVLIVWRVGGSGGVWQQEAKRQIGVRRGGGGRLPDDRRRRRRRRRSRRRRRRRRRWRRGRRWRWTRTRTRRRREGCRGASKTTKSNMDGWIDGWME